MDNHREAEFEGIVEVIKNGRKIVNPTFKIRDLLIK